MKKPLTFWNSINIISLWNSKSEVIKCLHGQGAPKARIQSQMILRSGLTPKPQRDLTSIARLIRLQGRRQFDKEYTCFWRKNKNIGSLLYLGGRTVNRYAPDPCGSGVNTLLHPPQKVNYDFFDRGIFMPDLRRETRLYHIWSNMKERCSNPNATGFQNYGGRGITVCPEWETDFLTFEEWAYSNGYREYLTIERIDNDKGYSPNNCRWATRAEQVKNRRSPYIPTFEINGVTKTAEEWAKIAGISRKRFYKRYAAGWRGEKLLSPLQKEHITR